MRETLYRQLTAVRATRKSLVVPAFAYPSTWAGVSQMLSRYSIGNTNQFSIKLPVSAPDDSFLAAVSWASSPYVYRYKLWEAGVLYFPLYAGERIGENAYIEIWSVNTATAELTADWTIQVSKLILPSICSSCTPNSELVTLAEVPFSSVPAYQYCNPFCSPLCS